MKVAEVHTPDNGQQSQVGIATNERLDGDFRTGIMRGMKHWHQNATTKLGERGKEKSGFH